MAAGVVHVPWYATGFRGDRFADALSHFAALSLRYGASDYQVYRNRDDRYRFLQTATFEHKLDWERYWEGEDAIAFRINYQGWYQVPVLYVWQDLLVHGGAQPESAATEGSADDSPTVA
jgi:hypothetical protein